MRIGTCVFEVRAGDGSGGFGGCGMNVLPVGAGVVIDELITVFNVALVYGVPSVVNDTVKFVRVTGVCAFRFVVRSYSGTFEGGDGFGLLSVYGFPGGGRAFP